MAKLVIVDVSNLAYRAVYAHGGLSHNGAETSAVYGVLRDIVRLNENLHPCTFAFAFEGLQSINMRRSLDPGYKANRGKTDEAASARAQVHAQVNRLGRELLPMAGFSNILRAPGYEADDVMAAAASAWDGEVYLVSSDQDLYQLLDLRTMVFSPRKWVPYNLFDFEHEWGIKPNKWPLAKALGGDASDNISGVAGVGLKTAIKYIRGEMKGGKKKTAIEQAMADGTAHRNLQLCTLPWPGLGKPKLYPDLVTADKWNNMARAVGAASLRDALPHRNPGTNGQGKLF